MDQVKRFCLLATSLALLACSRNPSMLQDLAGPKAEKTSQLFWFFAVIEIIVWALVLGFLFYSLWRRRESKMGPPLQPSEASERRALIGVSVAIGATVLILTTLVGASYVVDKQLLGFEKDPTVEIEVTAHQWWWELRYNSATESEIFYTANEMHIPVGENVRLKLRSSDVIHSLWFPNISGKQDVIPGRDQDLYIQADREGIFEGKCSEFCGLQHAYMGLRLFVDSKEKYAAWKAAQLQPSVEPKSDEEKHGRDVFTKGACLMCHVIRGTEAMGYSSNAPELTHLKSRTTIGAGAAPNTKGYLGGWIIDPHGIKPGVHMPTILQEPKDLQALLAYLEILK